MRRSLPLHSLPALFAVSIIAGCGGNASGGGDDNPPGGDNEAPLAVIQFPPGGCLTDAEEANLAIQASDETGVAFVKVGQTNAVLDTDGRWKISVPLQQGNNTIVVSTSDTLTNADQNADQVSVRRDGALWVETGALAFDAFTNQALVLDPALRTLFAVVPATGARSVRSGPGVGFGNAFAEPRDVDFMGTLPVALVTDGVLDAVIRVDLTNGNRTTLSSTGVGGGPNFVDLQGIAVESARNRALVLDDFLSAVLAVDLVSGQRTALSADGIGTGPLLSGPRRVAIDQVRNRALVTLALSRSIVAVDLVTGNRTTLSGGSTGGGAAFVAPLDIVVDVFQDRALVADPGAHAVFDVDLATGNRQILSSPTVGSGSELLEPSAVTLQLGNIPLVADRATDALIQVGAVNGDRVILSRYTQGSGPQLERPAALVRAFSTPDGVFVADETALFTVTSANGARALVSGRNVGGGPDFVDLVDLIVGDVRNVSTPGACLAALDAGLPGIVGIGTAGTRFVISGGAIGSGPAFPRPRGMAAESTVAPFSGCPASALVVDDPLGGPASVLRVDLVTGERTVLSDPTHGTGPDLVDPVAIEIDHASGTAFVLDAGALAILTVDPVSGDRAIAFAFPGFVGEPTGFALDTPDTFALVVAADPPALLSVDLAGGGVTTLSDGARGSGPAFGRPEDVVITFADGLPETLARPIALVLDAERAALFVVDPDTGDRLLLSK